MCKTMFLNTYLSKNAGSNPIVCVYFVHCFYFLSVYIVIKIFEQYVFRDKEIWLISHQDVNILYNTLFY